jgi:hypothetical protein
LALAAALAIESRLGEGGLDEEGSEGEAGCREHLVIHGRSWCGAWE